MSDVHKGLTEAENTGSDARPMDGGADDSRNYPRASATRLDNAGDEESEISTRPRKKRTHASEQESGEVHRRFGAGAALGLGRRAQWARARGLAPRAPGGRLCTRAAIPKRPSAPEHAASASSSRAVSPKDAEYRCKNASCLSVGISRSANSCAARC